MAQQHFDRLSALDASFLAQEGPSAHMHVGGVTLFEGPAPSYEEVLDQVRGRLHLVPRYRQRLTFPRFESGRPLWVDDPTFHLEYHVRQTALPRPGAEDQLMALTARVFSQPLDRSKPLWELWMVENVEDGRWALLSKNHHALIDGISGVDLVTVLFDLAPVPQPVPHPDAPWTPEPEPGAATVLASGALGAVRAGLRATTRAVEAVGRPGAALAATAEATQGLGELAWAILNPAPATPLNVEIGPHRRFVGVRNDLDRFKEVKDQFGGTVNDVVLTVVSGALRGWLRSRGVRTEGLELRALVPVSIRTADQHHQLGNRIVAMRGPLPVYIEDPVARLLTVSRAMQGLKESKQAVGAKMLTRAQAFAPPTVLAQASRLNFSTRLFNLIVTNVPGPQFPLYVRGRELQDVYPVAFLPKGHALAVAIMSYHGRMNFGLLADYDALPDVEDIGDGIREGLSELVALARTARAAAERGRDARGRLNGHDRGPSSAPVGAGRRSS
jgi:WS/DGAT/MGAT family acyltransferase